MKYKNKILTLALVLVVSVGCSSKNDGSSLVEMAKEKASIEETYAYNRNQSKADAFSNIIIENALTKKYGYDNNKVVKDLVDVEVKNIEQNNATLVKDYGLKDARELLDKSGQTLEIMKKQYLKDVYEKENVTDESLKAMYDKHEGEKMSYYEIKISPADFAYDTVKVADAKKDIEKQIKDAKKDNLKKVFDGLVKKYPGSETTPNKYNEQAERSTVNETILTKLDELKDNEAVATAIEIDGVSYYILKYGNGTRPTFEESKETLTDLQYDNATQENRYLTEFMLVQLREKQKVTFTNKEDETAYLAYNDAIKVAYEKAVKDLETSKEATE